MGGGPGAGEWTPASALFRGGGFNVTTFYAIGGLWLTIGFLLASAFAMEDGPCLKLRQRAMLFLMVMLLWPLFFLDREGE